MKDDGITKLIDGDIYYHYHYADYLYQELNKRDKEIERLKEENEMYKKEFKKIIEYINEEHKRTLDRLQRIERR